MPPVTFNIRPPVRGNNRREDAVNLSDLFLEDGENYEPFATYASNRKGFTKFNSVAETGIIKSQHAHVDSTGTDIVLYNIGRDIKKITSSAVTTIGTLSKGAQKSSFVSKNEKVFFGSDVDNKLIDTTANTIRSLGLPTQAVIPNGSLSLGAANTKGWENKSKKVRYVIQNIRKENGKVVNRGGITRPNVGTEGTLIFGTTDNDARIVTTFVNNPDITDQRIYRTILYTDADEQLGKVPTVFFFIGDTPNANGTFVDDKPDSDFASEADIAEAFEFQPLPASGLIEVVGERVFTTDPDNPLSLAFTHNFADQSFKGIFAVAGEIRREEFLQQNDVGNFEIEFGDIISQSGAQSTPNGLPIITIKRSGRDLYVFTAIRTYRIINADGIRVRQMEEIPEQIGCQAQFGVFEKDGFLMVNTNESGIHGIRPLQGGRYGADIVDYNHQDDMEATDDFTKTFLMPFEEMFWLGINDGKTFNNKVLAFKKVNGRWTTFKHLLNIQFGVALSNGDIITFDADTKLFHKQNDGFTDDGKAIKSRLRFVPLRGRTNDILQLVRGFLRIEQDSFFELRHFIDGNSGGGLIRVHPKDTDFDTFGNMNWNIGDPIDGASGFFGDSDTQTWIMEFDTESFGSLITLELLKEDSTEWRFKGAEIKGVVRRQR